MFRCIIAFACTILFSLGCLAQPVADNLATDPPLNGESQPSSIGVDGPSVPRSEQRISVARLKVPRKVRQLYDKALKAFQKDKPVKAKRKLDEALQQYPAFPEALTLCGVIQLNDNQWGAAEQNLQAAVRSDPAYSAAYVVLGDLYNTESRYDDALATTERAVALIPDTWLVQYEMARALIGKHQYDLALTISDAALRTNHGTVLHLARAHALAGLKRYPQAAAELRAYLHYQPAGEGSQQARDMLRQLNTRSLDESELSPPKATIGPPTPRGKGADCR
ncbi:MAG: tetratricopeptide repeat protein [Candidatus Angelobacter sp.]